MAGYKNETMQNFRCFLTNTNFAWKIPVFCSSFPSQESTDSVPSLSAVCSISKGKKENSSATEQELCDQNKALVSVRTS